MLKQSVNLLALALVALPGLSNAVPTAANTTVTGHGFGCEYLVTPDAEAVGLANHFGPIVPTNAKGLPGCTDNCDKDPRCLFAQFFPHGGRGNCQLYNYISFFKSPLKELKGGLYIQVEEGSCKKPVATPTSHVCEAKTVTLKNGCQFNVMCETQIKRVDAIGYIELTKSPLGCAQKAATIRDAVAFEWSIGGKCLIAEDKKGFATGHIVATKPNKDFETWQLVPGSCNAS